MLKRQRDQTYKKNWNDLSQFVKKLQIVEKG
mgnify:CR=1 FL=1